MKLFISFRVVCYVLFDVFYENYVMVLLRDKEELLNFVGLFFVILVKWLNIKFYFVNSMVSIDNIGIMIWS